MKTMFFLALAAALIYGIYVGVRRTMESNNTKIVIVGMANSAKFGKCAGADVDARAMNKILSKYGKTTVLCDSKATKAAVVSALSDAVNSDLCIFYYSGHGGSERFSGTNAKQGLEPTGQDQYLCLYNTHMLDDEIWNIVSKAKGRVMLIFDCCHSATMFRSVVNEEDHVSSEPFTMQMIDEIVLPQDSKMRILVWSGCPDDSYSYGDNNGGVLTNGIRISYREGRSYDEVWEGVSKKASN